MLKSIPVSLQPSWQECLSNLLTDPEELLAIVQLNAEQTGFSPEALKDFPLRVPRPYLNRITPGNPHDPLLLQILPHAQEMALYPGFSVDPLDEHEVNPCPGLLHKYNGRALLVVTSSCAIHCRYCFRRHFPYAENRPSKEQWSESLQYLASDSSIKEVILSGGDPLASSDKHLRWIIDQLAQISHIERLRIHTRLPIMIPQRITEQLCQVLCNHSMQTIIVIHSNHPQELDAEVDLACLRLKNSGAHLLNQSVLLRGINDNAATLSALSERLFKAGVLPYYLHLLDKVAGAGHFDVEQSDALALMRDIQSLLPGYLVPKLVRENAGESSKSPVN